MSNIRFPLIGGRVMRVTRLDLCGRPLYGQNEVSAVSEGFVSVGVTANYEDGEEISVTNASGKKCVSRAAEPELTDLGLEIVFCKVDPDIYTAVTGFPKILDPATGDVIGFKINRGVRIRDVRWALEVWSEAAGALGCDASGDVPWGYLLWPFLAGARIGDYTIENNAVTFTATDARTNDGTQWGRGPYEVVTDENGLPDVLQESLDALDHQWVLRTLVPPPLPTEGMVPLDNPDNPDASGAVAGLPGTWSPEGSVRPETLADLVASAIVADPTTAWTTGQFVFLGDGSRAYWDGDSWEAGAAL